jgi:preprotein translocase subunit SecF
MEFFQTPNLNFIRAMRVAVPISGIIVALSILAMVVIGPNLGIDFTGGTLVQVQVTPPVDIGQLRAVLEQAGFRDAGVQDVTATHDFLITFRQAQETIEADAASAITTALRQGLTGHNVDLRRQETVGPKIGGELRNAAVNAMALSLILMIIYMWFRFVLRYGFAAVIALAHDVIITYGIFVVFHLEVSLQIVAAFLTLVGYSINDKIVVFDRVRENMRLRRREGYAEVVNRSINETLSRTCLTSTVLMATGALWAFGGPVIRDFAMVMTLGVLIGTYSSAFIGCWFIIWWNNRFLKDTKRAQATM